MPLIVLGDLDPASQVLPLNPAWDTAKSEAQGATTWQGIKEKTGIPWWVWALGLYMLSKNRRR